eukprot:332605-Rhodomonas_salina.2
MGDRTKVRSDNAGSCRLSSSGFSASALSDLVMASSFPSPIASLHCAVLHASTQLIFSSSMFTVLFSQHQAGPHFC